MRISVLGSGKLGSALAVLFAGTGNRVVLGVRGAQGLPAGPRGSLPVPALSIPAAINESELVVLAIPFQAMFELAREHRELVGGRILVDATNPLNPDFSPMALEDGISAGEVTQHHFPSARVVKAFNTVFADTMTPERLRRGPFKIAAFMAGDDERAVEQVSHLAAAAGFSPIAVGALRQARYLEALANINLAVGFGRGKGSNIGVVYDIQAPG